MNLGLLHRGLSVGHSWTFAGFNLEAGKGLYIWKLIIAMSGQSPWLQDRRFVCHSYAEIAS